MSTVKSGENANESSDLIHGQCALVVVGVSDALDGRMMARVPHAGAAALAQAGQCARDARQLAELVQQAARLAQN